MPCNRECKDTTKATVLELMDHFREIDEDVRGWTRVTAVQDTALSKLREAQFWIIAAFMD
jgi:hypothetical protein